MECVLAGFRQSDTIREYYFDAVEKGEPTQRITVRADLALLRVHGIPLQELPLLCKRLLEGRAEMQTITFSESDIARYAAERAAATLAKPKRRKPRLPSSRRSRQPWPLPQPVR